MPYRDKIVIVTGGSRGIGEGIVRAFVAAGATVAFCDRRAAEGEALAAELSPGAPGRAMFHPVDVTDEPVLQRWIRTTADTAGRLDCLVNNAGWHPPHQPIDAFSAEDFRTLIELNLIGVFTACRAALKPRENDPPQAPAGRSTTHFTAQNFGATRAAQPAAKT